MQEYLILKCEEQRRLRGETGESGKVEKAEERSLEEIVEDDTRRTIPS